MITKDQALKLNYGDILHYTGQSNCAEITGPRGGKTYKVTRVRVSGKCKIWKRSPERFHIPVKYGMYESLYIDEHNCVDFHLAKDCHVPELAYNY